MSGNGAGSSPPRVLVVDDVAEVRHLLTRALEREGFAVDQAADGEEALSTVELRPPALVILDVNLPKIDGLQVLGRLKRMGDTPVILLTGRVGEADRIAGLDLGADDYVVKPFSTGEVVARVRAVLRRNRRAESGRRFEFPGLVIDRDQRQVLVDGRLVAVPRREFDLLVFLASSPGQVFTREQILQHVWQSSSDWQSSATVTEHVRRLRQRIEADPDRPRYLLSMRGVGYRFQPDPDAPSRGDR